MFKDVIEGLKLVKEGIQSVQTIAKAVQSGKDYLKAKHPDVRSDLRAMAGELGKSLWFVKQASAVLTNFRFAVGAGSAGTELRAFNDRYIQSKTEAQRLRDQIDDLRTHCSKVRDHAMRICGSAGAAGFAKLFAMLGLNSPEKEKELGEKLDRLAYEDFTVANSAQKMLECLESALRDIQDALGDGGAMYPEGIPRAAALLAQYGPAFEEMEEEAALGAKTIREMVKDLE
ncbi:MAG: hypothetical protein HY822_14110 [Acidobacteria bacterium]|nr:hypothetical protein [Acidobacteriota bacterium]